MTALALYDDEIEAQWNVGFEEGFAEGRRELHEKIVPRMLTSLMATQNMTLEEAFAALSVPVGDRSFYRYLYRCKKIGTH